MDNVTRFGVSVEPDLLGDFDAIIRRQGYTTRSEAVRDLVRKMIADDRMAAGNPHVAGTLTIMFDHDVHDLQHRLTHLQHHHAAEIGATMHMHLDKERCLEVVVVKGRLKQVKALADKIKAIKGVLRGELVITPM